MKIVPTADGSNTVFSEQYGQTFHSLNGAVTESRHVFLDASGVSQRLDAQKTTRVLEIGFGLGLNCLLTLDRAISTGAKLDYHAVDSNPSRQALTGLDYGRQLNHKSLPQKLAAALYGANNNSSQSHQTFSGQSLYDSQAQVTLHTMDATLGDLPSGPFNAIYLDPFSPDVNPECWTIEFLSKLYQQLHPDGVMTTYSAKGSVRRAMLQAGFHVKKMAGPPGKREMLAASPAEFSNPGT